MSIKYQTIWLLLFFLYKIESLNISSNFAEQIVNTDDLSKCIVTLSNNYSHKYTLLITAVNLNTLQLWNISNTKIIISVNETLHLISSTIVFEKVIMILNTIQQFKHWIDELKLMRSWNPRGKFVIAILQQENIVEIFKVAWSYYVLNINVIVYNQTRGSWYIYTYFPYKTCKNNIQSELLYSCDNITKVIFPEKIPEDFQGCNVKIMAPIVPPYVLSTTKPDRSSPKSVGLEVVLMHHLSELLNFSEEYIPQKFPDWGVRLLPARKYNFIYNVTFHRGIDMFFGKVPFDGHFFEDFENSYPYFIDITHWWVPAAREIPRWKNAVNIFHYEVWTVIFFSIFVNGGLWYLFGRRYNEVVFKYLPTSLLGSWQVLLQSGITQPRNINLKIIYLSWTLFSLLISTAYQSQLISILSKPQYENQISTTRELLASKLKFGFSAPMTRYFSDPNDETHIAVTKNFIDCPLSEECVNRTAFKRDFAVMKNRRQTMYLMKKYYLNKEGKPMMYGFQDGVLALPHMVAYKGYPFLDKINIGIMKMLDHGLMQKWNSDVAKLIKYDVELKTNLRPLSLESYAVVFLIYFILIGLAIVSFFLEIFCYRRILQQI